MRSRFSGFTIVELLVVVTIIVVLLALLIPAMGNAIYQAELTQCSAKQKAIGSIFQVYATDNIRDYPSNLQPRYSQDWAQPDFLGVESEPATDLRPLIWPKYLDKLDIFLCPLLGEIDLGYEANGPETRVFGNYLLFAGWKYPTQINTFDGRGMIKVGDQLQYMDYRTNTPASSKTLLMDNHISHWPTRGPVAQSSHPCRTQELRKKVQMNQDTNDVDPGTTNPLLDPIPSFGVPGVGTQLTYSVWIGGNNPRLDINTTGTDLSVQRHNNVERYDNRFNPAQVHADYAGDQSVHIYLPK